MGSADQSGLDVVSDITSHLLRTSASPSVFQLFRHASWLDIAFFIIGCILSLVLGVALPAATWVFYQFFLQYQLFLNAHPNPSVLVTESGIAGSVWLWVKALGLISIISLVVGFIQSFLMEWFAERRIKVLREHYLEALYSLPMAYHEVRGVDMLLRRMNRDFDILREGIGNAGLPRILQSIISTILCLVLAFLR
ncbi:ABC transporter type 1, transmembrane domain-containing protein, partial [Piptocephalis cylindrospora]